jgi:hypothetical protein
MGASVFTRSIGAVAVILALGAGSGKLGAQQISIGVVVEGFVSDINLVAGTISIQPSTGVAIQINVQINSIIKFDDVAGRLDRLRVGDRAIANHHRDTGDLIELRSYRSKSDGTLREVFGGTVTAVDTTGSTLTIKRFNGESLTLTVTGTTRIEENTQPATLGQIQVGDFVHGSYDPTTSKAVRIRAYSPRSSLKQRATVFGTVTAVDTTMNKLTIKPLNSDPVTVNITSVTTIVDNMAPAKLGQILVNDHAIAHYEVSTNNAIDVFAYTPKQPATQTATFAGTVTAVDMTASTLTVKQQNGAPLTLTVTMMTTIKHNTLPALLAQIQVGDVAYGTYDPTTGKAIDIRSYSTRTSPTPRATVFGTVTAVDTTMNKLTIKPLTGDPVTVNITTTTTILHNLRIAGLGQILVNDHALVHYEVATSNAVDVLAYTPR